MVEIKSFLVASTATLLVSAAMPSHAEDLRIALSSEPTAADPHYHNLSTNNALAQHIFEALTSKDENQNVRPSLAESWQGVDENNWVFKLRKGVVFSDGSAFDADDVIFTFCRVLNNKNNVSGSFAPDVENIARVETPDPYTINITTKQVEPLLPELLSQISILSSDILKHGDLSFDTASNCGVTGAWPTVENYNNGSMTIGTGPFVLDDFTKGSNIRLSRNEKYWGEAPAWEKVELVPVPSSGPRLAGLLAGDFDFIESPSARDVKQLSEEFAFTSKPSSRVIFLQMDVARDESPFIQTENGKNPFQDERVRRAVSLAINREAIVERIMDGFAEPASQFVPKELFGAQPDPVPLTYDPEGAKELLAEAGYPNGFKVTLSATNDRYINDSQVAQAIAQFLTRVGIGTELDAMTRSIFFSRRSKQEFSFSMGGWGSTSEGAASFLRNYVTTGNKERGVGGSNYGGWSDPAFDKVLLEAIETVDPEKRAGLLEEAGKMALDKLGLIPIHFESSLWAYRKGFEFSGRMDQYIMAQEIKPAK
jgi:peptide/nickel transport system substrate-binding protein